MRQKGDLFHISGSGSNKENIFAVILLTYIKFPIDYAKILTRILFSAMKQQNSHIDSSIFDRSLSLCDELFITMEQIQARLDTRRGNMMKNADRLISAKRKTRFSTTAPSTIKVY